MSDVFPRQGVNLSPSEAALPAPRSSWCSIDVEGRIEGDLVPTASRNRRERLAEPDLIRRSFEGVVRQAFDWGRTGDGHLTVAGVRIQSRTPI